MATKHWVLFQEPNSWQVGWKDADGAHVEVLSAAADSEPEAAAAIAQALDALGYQGDGILLAAHSSSCLAATLTPDDPAAAHQTQTLLYQLEQAIPLAAEDIVADFVIRDGEVLGVAIPVAAQKSLLDSLEQHGVHVQSISPAAILALQQWATTLATGGPCLVLWQNAEEVEWFWMSAKRLLGWRVLPAEVLDLLQNVRVESLRRTEPLDVIGVGLSTALRDALFALPNVKLQEANATSQLESAIMTAENVLAGAAVPWIELRRDVLGSPDPYRAIRGSLRFAVGAAAALLVAMIGGWSYQDHCYEQLAAAEQRRQAAAFCEAFPGQSVPAGIRSRLESEYAKLSGLKGASSQLPSQTSSLQLLYDVLASLPEGMRYRFQELRFDRQRAFLDGEVLSHGDADRLSTGLRNRGFQVQPPRTQQLAGQGVSVRLTAELAKKTPGQSKGDK